MGKGKFIFVFLVLIFSARPAVAASCFYIQWPDRPGPRMALFLDMLDKHFPSCVGDPGNWDGFSISFKFPPTHGRFEVLVAEMVPEGNVREGSESFWQVGEFLLPVKLLHLDYFAKEVIAAIEVAVKRKPDSIIYDYWPGGK
ncbi:MAG: hypothetical protein G01um101429_714 [Parcubacteria group bacterium Gr01-1014_29]|nr:MAG: hypothetical protein G01um101429_714 [Parcubacteria group bacterium Gr01-1014_29]